MVDRLHGEVEGHELDDWLEATHRRPRPQTGKAIFGDRRIDDALRSELVEQALRHLIGALVLRDFLAHDKDAVVFAHFLGHGIAEGFADGDAGQRRTIGHFRRVMGLRHVGDQVAGRRFHLVRSRRSGLRRGH